MNFLANVWRKLSGNGERADSSRNPIRVFLLDDDVRRHQWFVKRFVGDEIDIAETPTDAIAKLSANSYDAIFLDHDLLPEHYKSSEPDDERTGYAVAAWLASHPEHQPASTIMVHTRNADAAIRMVEALRATGRLAEYVPFPMLEHKIKNYWK